MLNIANTIPILDSSTNGAIPISKEVVAKRGNAKNGPITRYKSIVKIYAYFLLTRLAISNRPSLFDIPIAIIPKKGNPTPVIKKPIFARNTLLPAS
ncbi:hypothetical protein SDC9_140434 [bioreactor metagenome]|uniref:Uncharacterized protein n=1 Tax=bioreactor metagenome TaxID=1076179 RepID=A0A645DVZ0_9ZZZZ